MYESEQSEFKNRLCVMVVLFYFVVNIAVLLYLVWAGYTQEHGYLAILVGGIILILSQLVENYVPNKILDGKYFAKDDDFGVFLFILAVSSVTKGIMVVIYFALGLYIAYLWPTK